MSSSLNLSLTDELREFVNQHSGDGTPSEFVRDILRQVVSKKALPRSGKVFLTERTVSDLLEIES